jgi:hypothetical protein
MQATNGLGVILENRYYGESYPFNSSTTDELAYLTTEQSLIPPSNDNSDSNPYPSYCRQRLFCSACFIPWDQRRCLCAKYALDSVWWKLGWCPDGILCKDISPHLVWRHCEQRHDQSSVRISTMVSDNILLITPADGTATLKVRSNPTTWSI